MKPSDQAQDALADVNSWCTDYREIVESIEDYAIILLDPAGTILTWNRGAELMCGYRSQEIIGHHFSRLYIAEEAAAGKPARDLVQAAEQGRFEEDGWRLRKDGTRWWANVVVRASRDGEGRLRGFLRVARDDSERRRVEERIREEQVARAEADATSRRLTAIQAVTDASLGALELVPMLQELLARVRTILAADAAAIFLADADGAHLTRAASSGFVHPLDQPTRIPFGQGVVGQVAARGLPIAVPEIDGSDVVTTVLQEHIRSLAGAPLMVESRVIGVLYVGSRAHRLFTLEEVSLLGLCAIRAAAAVERARAHAELSESERRFRATFEQSAVGCAFRNCQGRVLLVNDTLCRILGYPREELCRMTSDEVTYPDDRPAHVALSQRLDRGEIDSYSLEKRYLRRDGEIVWADVTASLVRNAAGAPEYAAYIMQDISERKQAEQERDRLLSELTKALAARDRFLRAASHELKTPLTSLMLLAQTFARSAADANDDSPGNRLGASASMVLRQTRRLATLVDQLLEVSHTGVGGSIPLELDEVDLVAVTRGAASSLEEEAIAARAPITVHAAEAPVLGRGDRARLDVALKGLLSNALKYGAGHPVSVGVRPNGDLGEVTVRDEGVGIRPEDQARIFERYEQATPELEAGGLGIGLWIAREIVVAHGGTIRVESQPERGTTFTVELPRVRQVTA
jgi:PAS domain S-box-containing protein